MFRFDLQKVQWINPPENYVIEDNKVQIITNPHTDLWQRTYYGFRNDNGHILYMVTDEKYFSFTVETFLKANVCLINVVL